MNSGRLIQIISAMVLLLTACGDDASVLRPGGTEAGTVPAASVSSSTLPSDAGAPPTGPAGDWVSAGGVVPDPGTPIDTVRWGAVYDRRIVLGLAGDATADSAAAAVGGTVLSRIEDYGIAEIEITAPGEEALSDALDILGARDDVELAIPSSVIEAALDVVDRPCGPLDDLALEAEGRSDQYRLTGVEDAWRLVHASGVVATPPRIGVVDGASAVQGYHGLWVREVIDAAPGNPPGVLDAVLGDGAATIDGVDVFGSSATTSDTALIRGVRSAVARGATVVNVSAGNSAATPGEIALWHRFLRDLAANHPDVVVVASANNQASDSAASVPGGLAEPNLITVGGLDHTGHRWEDTWTDATGTHTVGSNHMVTGGEVTLAVIAEGVFTGIDSNGVPVSQNGTSFAAPQVASAAAVLKALDPTLTGPEIKQILADTAATEIADPLINERITAVDPSLGGRLLRVDNAVWHVLSERLGVTGTREEVLARATVAARARQAGDDPLSYRIIARAPGSGDGTMLTIVVNGPGVLAPGGDGLVTTNDVARWGWGFFAEGDSAQFTLTRTDTGACARIVLSTGPPGTTSTSSTTTSTTTTTSATATTEPPVNCDDCPAGLEGLECRLHCVRIDP